MASQQCYNKIMLNDTLFEDLQYSESWTGVFLEAICISFLGLS